MGCTLFTLYAEEGTAINWTGGSSEVQPTGAELQVQLFLTDSSARSLQLYQLPVNLTQAGVISVERKPPSDWSAQLGEATS